ncbi:hypothetical protein ACIQGZ_23625 [Streptomyces sp. NPDC092296]|uniref:hypothetical protein n=1 Tax=Streptomyces sp. NPDC092296 TaxID=3366012 RepID=UPI003802793A
MPATAPTALDHADEAVDGLLESGRAPSDVLVLTSGDAHPWQRHESSFGEEHYWAQLEEGGDVFYADALATRAAAAREVVVLACNGTEQRNAQALTAALGTARTLLLVCGDPAQLGTLLDGIPQPAHA